MAMKMSGEFVLPADQQTVWQMLNDPQVLKASIPGCEELEKISDTEFKARAKVKIGPVSATFKGNVELTDLDPPNSYRIKGEGEGGIAGFAKGGALVTLSPEGDGTQACLRRRCPGWRQDRPARRALDQWRRQEDRG